MPQNEFTEECDSQEECYSEAMVVPMIEDERLGPLRLAAKRYVRISSCTRGQRFSAAGFVWI